MLPQSHFVPDALTAMAIAKKGPFQYIAYLAARTLMGLLGRLPLRLAYRGGRALGWLCWKCLGGRRRLVRKNLEVVNAWAANEGRRAIFGGLDLDAQVREVFLRNGANLVSGFGFDGLSVDAMESALEIGGLEHLEAALAEGHGVIALTVHMGPWEALAQLRGLAERHGIQAPFGAIYRPFNNYYFEHWQRTHRARMGTHLFDHRRKFYAPVDFLRAGGILSVMSDQRVSGGERVRYFGKWTKSTPLPGLLHLRSKAPILAVALRTVGPARWRIEFRPVTDLAAAEDRSRAALAQAACRAMEMSLCTSVYDGFWFTNRFKDATSES